MDTRQKNYMLMAITEDYLIRHGHGKPDFSKSFFALPMGVISCIGDIAELCQIKARHGQSPARTLWHRLQKVWAYGEEL